MSDLNKRDDPVPQLYTNKENCCGCFACLSVCPVTAIYAKEDDEGFLYPEIDLEKCIRCQKCLSVCAFKKDQKEKGYSKV